MAMSPRRYSIALLVVLLLLHPWLSLAPLQYSVLLIFAALPPAVLNYLLAEQYRQEPERVASLVLLGNLGAQAIRVSGADS